MTDKTLNFILEHPIIANVVVIIFFMILCGIVILLVK